MLIAIVPIVFAVAGLVTYALAANPKIAEVGRLVFACGTLVALLVSAHQVVHLM